VIVWRNEKAHEEALALIRAGVHKNNPALLVPLIACAPVAGTRAVTTSVGVLTHDIIVVEGKTFVPRIDYDTGPQSVLPMEDRMKCLTLALKQDLRVLHPFHHLKAPVRAGAS
jgi:hypothetical protein